MRKDTTDRQIYARKLTGTARKRAFKAAKRADKTVFQQEIQEFI